MPEVFAAQPFSNFLAGRGAYQAERQQAADNAMRQQQFQMQQAQFERQQQEQARAQQFNQLAAQFLGPNDVAMAGGMPQGGDPNAPEFMPPQQSQPPSFSQLVALDPQRAFQLQQYAAAQQEQKRAAETDRLTKVYNLTDRVLRSADSPTMARHLLATDTIGDLDIKSMRDALEEKYGVPLAEIPDELLIEDIGLIGDKAAVGAGIAIADSEESTDDIVEYNRAVKQGYAGSLQDWIIENKRAGAVQVNVGDKLPAPPSGQAYLPDPTSPFGYKLAPIPGAKEAPATEGDKKNRVLVSGMVDAERQIGALKGGDSSNLQGNVAGLIPIVGGYLQPDSVKQYNAAAERWAANYLYVKSGATAGKDEVSTTVRQFFPQPGDSPDVVRQKNESRANELKNMGSTYAPNAQLPTKPQSFASEAEAEAAGLKPGTRIVINGVPGTWQ